ncbi:MAG: hypothetical protein ACRBC3_20860 [Burkholderiaceae bacterium]
MTIEAMSFCDIAAGADRFRIALYELNGWVSKSLPESLRGRQRPAKPNRIYAMDPASIAPILSLIEARKQEQGDEAAPVAASTY